MLYLRTLVIMLAFMSYVATAQAATLGEFEQALQQGDIAQLTTFSEQIVATKSPEFIVRAERAMGERAKPLSEDEKALRIRLAKAASTLKPTSHNDAKWIGRAQYDLARTYLDRKEDGLREKAVKLLGSATKHGHPKAPARLAKLIRKKKPNDAITLLELSISRGNVGALLMLAELRGDEQEIKRALKTLERKARRGNKSAKDALEKYRKKQSNEDAS